MAELESGASESSAPAATPLSDMFDNKPSESASSEASTEKENESSEEKGSQKFLETESSSEKSDEKKETDEKESPESKTDPKEKVPAKSDPKKEEKPSDDKKAADKWDTEENPYKKRFQDTSANWNKEHQEKLQHQSAVAQLQQENAILRKIADGTYDPEKDDPRASITPEVIANKA